MAAVMGQDMPDALDFDMQSDFYGSDWDVLDDLGDDEPSLTMLDRILSEVTMGAAPGANPPHGRHGSPRVPAACDGSAGGGSDAAPRMHAVHRGGGASSRGPAHRCGSADAYPASPLPRVPSVSWNTSRPSSSHSMLLRGVDGRRVYGASSERDSDTHTSILSQHGCAEALPLPDDIVRYILSYLYPIRELYATRLSCKGLKQLAETLRIDCKTCSTAVGWKGALGCDVCHISSCRDCAGLQQMPAASVIKTYTAARCKSCGGRLDHQWQCCPWCSTLRGGARKIVTYVRQTTQFAKPKPWIPHKCGHSMQTSRVCKACTRSCSRCGELACSKCIWCDGSRKACYCCAVTSGR